jgi:hypothetical protein
MKVHTRAVGPPNALNAFEAVSLGVEDNLDLVLDCVDIGRRCHGKEVADRRKGDHKETATGRHS